MCHLMSTSWKHSINVSTFIQLQSLCRVPECEKIKNNNIVNQFYHLNVFFFQGYSKPKYVYKTADEVKVQCFMSIKFIYYM